MNRGAGRAPILATAWDNELFLECLAEGTTRYGMEIHGYCLMTTHYHVLMLSTVGKLSDAMRFLSGRFTRLKNLRDGSDGPLFRGRYHSVAIETNAHLMQASRYIHLNPVAAGVAQQAIDWPWSSAAAYLTARDEPRWLRTNAILEMIGDTDSRHSYAEYLKSGVDQQTLEFYARL